MRLSNIKSLFDRSLSMKEFRTKIHEVIEQYKSGSKELGRNMPVFLNEDAELNFGENELKILCIAY